MREENAPSTLDELTLYHVTPVQYDVPDFNRARKRLERGGKCLNGVLGLWVSNCPDACSGFGPEIAKITLHKGLRPIGLPLNVLYKLYQAIEEDHWPMALSLDRYESLREQFKAHGDVLFITDHNNAVGEVVVLDEKFVKRMDFIPNHDWEVSFEDLEVKLPRGWTENPGSQAVLTLALETLAEFEQMSIDRRRSLQAQQVLSMGAPKDAPPLKP